MVSGGGHKPWLLAAYIVVALFVILRIVAVGVSDFYAPSLPELPRDHAEDANAWDPRNASAWRERAANQSLPDAVRNEARRESLLLNPTAGDLLAQFAPTKPTSGEDVSAATRIALALQLRPADAQLAVEAARYYLSQQRLDESLRLWNTALSLDVTLGPQLFPVLLAVLEDAALRAQLTPVVVSQPNWWQPFFRYVAVNALSVANLRELLRMTRAVRAVTDEERGLVVQRLQRENLWGDAYVEWLNQQPTAAIDRVGLLYNGDFSQWPAQQPGFDWRFVDLAGVKIAIESTYGTGGKGALHLVFRGDHPITDYVAQYLLLSPGRYRFDGRFRIDSLTGNEGVIWQLQCVGEFTQRTTLTERLLGLAEWQKFSAEFVVPAAGCAAQRLALRAVAEAGSAIQLRGDLWFDDLAIQRSESRRSASR